MATPTHQPVKLRGLGWNAQPGRPAHSPHRNRKIAGRSALAVLLVLAMVTGSLAGLTLVYSVDLPQIDELEHYRP